MSSVYTIPLLFLNLGGEMLYILDQRLGAQRIPKDRAYKVMNDITGIMLHQRFLTELFKPQEVYNKPALRQLFEDLAHASIMRLNAESMSKLYDLMTMVFKYQVVMCSKPEDILLVTLNHMDAMRRFVSAPHLHKQLDDAYAMLMATYGNMTFGELQTLRYSLLNFLQDIKVRVSVFLRENIQTNEGRFVIPMIRHVHQDNEVPGFIRYFDSNGEVHRMEQFYSGGCFTLAPERGSFELNGDRWTELGCNIYKIPVPATLAVVQEALTCVTCGTTVPEEETGGSGFHAGREELNLLLAQLMGKDAQRKDGDQDQIIYVNLFKADEIEEEEVEAERRPADVMIDARQRGCSDALQRVIGEMSLITMTDSRTDERDEAESLLDLIDDLE